MGCNSSKANPTAPALPPGAVPGAPPIPGAPGTAQQPNTQQKPFPMTQQFEDDWSPFLEGRTPAEYQRVTQASTTFQSHVSAAKWADLMLEQKIRKGLETRNYEGGYRYDQYASNEIGEIRFKVSIRKPAGAVGPDMRTMEYVFQYSVPIQSLTDQPPQSALPPVHTMPPVTN
eukprot:PhF_6_TR38280/c0_g1_i1/m.57118